MAISQKLHAFALGLFDLFGDCGHIVSRTAVDDFYGCGTTTQRGAGAIDRRIAAADHHDMTLERDRLALYAMQEVESLLDAL